MVDDAVNQLLDDRAEEAAFLLEALLILGQEPVEIMQQHPVEHGALRMTGTVYSCHSRGSFIKKRAKLMDTDDSPCLNEKSMSSVREVKPRKRQPVLTVTWL